MKTIRFILFVFALLINIFGTNAQNKYALLITGNPAPRDEEPPSAQWAYGESEINEFWNDTFLFHELLVEDYNYSEENVFVFYADGTPYPYIYSDYPDRYISSNFLDGASHSYNVVAALQELANKMNEHDFLFVWVFSHGWIDQFGEPYFCLNNIRMTATAFAYYVNQIPAAKKVIWMQPCSGGAFWDKFTEENNVIFTSAAHSLDIAHRADDLDNTGTNLQEGFDENEIWPESLIPCQHGEFNYHMLSATKGESPNHSLVYGNSSLTPFSLADIDGDNVVSVYEAYAWENEYQSKGGSWVPNPENPQYEENILGTGMTTSLNYPFLVSTISELDLNTPNTGIYGITSSITIPDNNFLIFGPQSKVYLLNNANIFVQNGATLSLQDSVEIYGNSQNSIRIDNGSIDFGQYVVFSNHEDDQIFDGLYLTALATPTVIDHATFTRTLLHNECLDLVINQTTFSNSTDPATGEFGLISEAGNINISQSSFDGTSIYLINPEPKQNPDWMVHVHHCNFNGNEGNPYGSLNIDGYQNFKIEYNIFNNITWGAINISHAGNGSTSWQSISQNNIVDCTWGVNLASSNANIVCNNIHHTGFGLLLGDYSNTSVTGNTTLDQKIKDCYHEEVYALTESFPVVFQCNSVIDENNAGGEYDALVKCINNSQGSVSLNLENNCWGNQFTPSVDLFGTNVTFDWTPTWCPGNPGPVDPPIDMYTSAINQYDSGNYSNAISTFKEIIELYPHSIQAQASIKELFSIERLGDDDYLSLQQYFLTNDSIIADSSLLRLGKYFGNRCNEKIENWSDEIAWFEDKIVTPESESDSIYAILDLSYIYLLMENCGTKSAYVGGLPQFKPKSLKKFLPYRDSLLSMLPGDQSYKRLVKKLMNLREGELLQNTPNPANGNTDIYYRLNSPAFVDITLIDMFNKEVKNIHENECIVGVNKLHLNLEDLRSGMYYYLLKVNGKATDAKKLVVL